MSEFEYKGDIDQQFPWSFLGFFSGLIFGIFGLYTVFIYEKAPELKTEVISNAPVFSVNEEIDNLEISFDNVDIRKAKLQLSIFTLKISNVGNLPITTGDFDEKDPFGINVDNGNIIKSDILNTSSGYFRKMFKNVEKSKETVYFPKFILEPSQFFVFKLMVLHDVAVQPSILPIGTIAKVGELNVINSFSEGEPNLIKSSFSGNTETQAIRIGAYGLGTTGFIILFMNIYFKFNLKYKIYKKKKLEKININKGENFINTLDEPTARKLRPFVHLLAKPDDFSYGGRSMREMLENFHNVGGGEYGRKILVSYINNVLQDLPLWLIRESEMKSSDIDEKFIEELSKLERLINAKHSKYG